MKDTNVNEALENLKLLLTSPRKRADTTIYMYLATAKTFLTWFGDNRQPTEKDWRLYFLHRRDQGISERSLRTEFAQLKKLAQANEWQWSFTKEDRPTPEGEPFAPTLTIEEIETIIRARKNYSRVENFYLSLAVTWGLRREEMVRVHKRDWDSNTIFIRRAKGGQQRRHMIPDEIKEILEQYRPQNHTTRAVNYLYHRIETKSGLREHEGYGFHAIRRSLATFLPISLAKNNLPISLVADFMGWSKTTKGLVFFGAAMPGVYGHPEIMDTDPYGVDRLVLPVHPFLSFYR